jgi:putative transposase
VKYAWIRAERGNFPIGICCEVLGVSTSGYYEHQRSLRKPRTSADRITDTQLLVLIKSIHAQVKQEYGAPMIHRTLKDRGVAVGKERVRKLMQAHGIRSKTKRRFRVTTDSKHNLPIAPNIVDRNFTATAPDQVWTTDITYLDTGEGWLYLTVFIDLFSRRVVGFAIDDHMRTDLVLSALRMGWFRRRPKPGLIVHSDRGSQYCSDDFRAALKAYGMISSMSRKGNCWDNAPTESLWSRLKVARVHGRKFSTMAECKVEVMDWLHFYNSTRLHSTLGKVSPMKFEEQWHAAKQQRAA